jgi:hypothetical protein
MARRRRVDPKLRKTIKRYLGSVKTAAADAGPEIVPFPRTAVFDAMLSEAWKNGVQGVDDMMAALEDYWCERAAEQAAQWRVAGRRDVADRAARASASGRKATRRPRAARKTRR